MMLHKYSNHFQLFRRIIDSAKQKRQYSYRLSFQNDFGSSIDPDMEDVVEWERNLQGAVTHYRLISRQWLNNMISQKVVRSAVSNQTFLLSNSTKRRLLSALPKQKRLSCGPILKTATQSLPSVMSMI